MLTLSTFRFNIQFFRHWVVFEVQSFDVETYILYSMFSRIQGSVFRGSVVRCWIVVGLVVRSSVVRGSDGESYVRYCYLRNMFFLTWDLHTYGLVSCGPFLTYYSNVRSVFYGVSFTVGGLLLCTVRYTLRTLHPVHRTGHLHSVQPRNTPSDITLTRLLLTV